MIMNHNADHKADTIKAVRARALDFDIELPIYSGM